jgi:hypothetical protein
MKTLCAIKSVSLSETRWLAYATAGVAGAFGLSSSAEAEIHYSGNVFVTLIGNARARLPLSNGASLYFKNSHGTDTFLQWGTFLMKGVISGSVRGEDYGINRIFLSNLRSGVNVSAGEFYSVTGKPDHGVLFTFWSDGQFAPNGGPVRGFVGFRFNTGNGTQYGWARIQTTNVSNHARYLIKDYAWGDVGDVILTGQTRSLQSGNANSVSGSLGQLAFGAQGLDAWRAQRTQKPN